MRKCISIILSALCILTLAGCRETDTCKTEISVPSGDTEEARCGVMDGEITSEGNGSELMTAPAEDMNIRNVFTGEFADITENEDIRTLSDLLCADAWNAKGTTAFFRKHGNYNQRRSIQLSFRLRYMQRSCRPEAFITG